MNKLKLGDGKTIVGAGALKSGEEGIFFRGGGMGVGVKHKNKVITADDEIKLFMQFSNTKSIDVVISQLEILKRFFGEFDNP